ncbi:MAG: glycyl-radical enzyme activating protein [Ruminococcaceae bacterium]|nr:glycyl-radical enzyme activating protein [Oscillospiraceae bacterium]
MKQNTIFNIQKFCINDGPGIRTTVFLKGCPLNCIWCHNPESKKIEPQLFYNKDKCIGCGRCVDACPNTCHTVTSAEHLFDRTNCIVCGACADACVTEALERAGEKKTVDEIITEVMKDEIFYQNSGGGMTLSGGEPMLQFSFAYDLMKAAKEKNLHTCMETCGFAPWEHFEKIAPLVDIFLYDYKETNPQKHKEFTGVTNELILNNLHTLDDMGANTVLRCPIIPTLNDREDHFEGIANTANNLKNIMEINIEPYHPLGSGKSVMLGGEDPLKGLTFPENETIEQWISSIQEKTKVLVKKA